MNLDYVEVLDFVCGLNLPLEVHLWLTATLAGE